MSDLVSLVRRVRRAVGDRPLRTWILDDPLTAGATSITIDADHAGYFPSAGIEICFDDATDEMCVTTGPADPETGGVPVARGQDGTNATEHAKGVALLKSPRFSSAQILDAVHMIVDNELWPDVWVPAEATLAYQATSEYYAAPMPDIEEIVYAYQLSGGRIWPVRARFLSQELARDADFPDGAIIVDGAYDAVDIRCAFRVRPTVGTLTSELEHLVVLGAAAHLVLGEELAYSGGADDAVSRRLDPGTKLRAGAVNWDRFRDARAKERIRLQHAEQLARVKLFGPGVG